MADPTPPTSALPLGVVERTIKKYARTEHGNDSSSTYPRITECVQDNIVVAHRWYDDENRLLREIPLNAAGQQHGLVLDWHDETEQLSLAEPYVNGVIHGTAHQWDYDGRYLGQYTLSHGSGFDIWRRTTEDGSVYVSEVHTMRNNKPHGYEWCLDEDRQLWFERHWVHGRLHGIERAWNTTGGLRRDAPRYWVSNEKVDKRRYTRAAAEDASLPPFQASHQHQERTFPTEVQRAISGRADHH